MVKSNAVQHPKKHVLHAHPPLQPRRRGGGARVSIVRKALLDPATPRGGGSVAAKEASASFPKALLHKK